MLLDKGKPDLKPVVAARLPSGSSASDRRLDQNEDQNHNQDPPPYSTYTQPPIHPATHNGPRMIHVRSLHSRSPYKPITGSYCIDPDLVGKALEFHADTKLEKCKGKRGFRAPPDASFVARHSAVRLTLAAVSNAGAGRGMRPARVSVSTNSGDVVITLMQVQPMRYLNLEVTSRRGNLFLLVPRTYFGALQLTSVQGTLTFLPAFARGMRMLKQNGNDVLVLFGSPPPNDDTAAPGSGQSFGQYAPAADYCELTTKQGKISIGVTGEDKLPKPNPGLLQKIGMFFTGETEL